MGRYPFLAWVNKYLAEVVHTHAPSTVKEEERRYRRMYDDLKGLLVEGKISSSNPEKFTPEDVRACILFQKAKEMKDTAISHDLACLNNLLLFAANNSAVETCKRRYPNSRPRKAKARLPPMGKSDYAQILVGANQADEKDWKSMRAYGVVVLFLCSGLRLNELRTSKVSSLNTKEWTIWVEHPKGEATYGEQRTAVIRAEGRDFIKKYLRLRAEWVAKKCPNNQALFPKKSDVVEGFFSTNGIEKLKRFIETETGIDFDARMCRRTYTQNWKDDRLGIEAISKNMGHETTETTEESYCRIRDDAAIREAQELIALKSSYPDARNPLAEKRWGMTGYA